MHGHVFATFSFDSSIQQFGREIFWEGKHNKHERIEENGNRHSNKANKENQECIEDAVLINQFITVKQFAVFFRRESIVYIRG